MIALENFANFKIEICAEIFVTLRCTSWLGILTNGLNDHDFFFGKSVEDFSNILLAIKISYN